MDLNETNQEVINRHPWELSRTKCTLNEFSRYLGSRKKKAVYINVGAGDLYFDKVLLKRYAHHKVHAVDLGYENRDSDNKRIQKYHYLEEVSAENIDYAIMMDSLEYMEDDVEYVRKLSNRIKKGGYFFFTLPAFPILFSDHDVNVKNLRRYSRKSFDDVLRKVKELEKVEDYYFYTSLFFVRFLQKMLRLPIDPDHKVTAYWKYPKNSLITKFFVGCLNLDFLLNRLFSRIGIRFPGLSMMVICRKK